jgi:hypothetical protein
VRFGLTVAQEPELTRHAGSVLRRRPISTVEAAQTGFAATPTSFAATQTPFDAIPTADCEARR